MLYTPEEINQGIKIVTELILLIGATAVGVFTRELIFPSKHKFGKKIGFALLAGFIAFGIMLKFTGIGLEILFLICIGLGFFICAFENWFVDKKIFKIIGKIAKGTKSALDTTIDVIGEELNGE